MVRVGEREIRIEARRCIGCWECTDMCPQSAGTEYPVYARGDRIPSVVNPDSCLGCLTCVFACRSEAITVGGKRPAEGLAERRAEVKARLLF